MMTMFTGRGAGLLIAGAAAIVAVQPTRAQAEQRLSLDLPAQPLAETLLAIARAAGREILFAQDAVEGRAAAPLKGDYTLEEAVGAALAGSGLVADMTGGAVLVRTADGSRTAGAPRRDAGPIVVTGSRIRGAASTSPVIATTRESLEKGGINDLGGFARILPQNFTGGQNPGVVGGGQQGGQNNVNNSTTLNLRGLGPDATLTLINGRRTAYDALNQGVDISAIPLAAIERVEVIADGASALYGSDAVAGVANVILRRDYEGARISARVGGATEGGDAQQQYVFIAGSRWGSGGLMAAADYNSATAIMADQRDYTSGLHPSATILPEQWQASLVAAGHQQLADGLRLVFDAQLSNRHSEKANVFFTTSDALTNGLFNRPRVRNWGVSPGLEADLPGGWSATLEGTHGESRTTLLSRFTLAGNATVSQTIYRNRLSAIEAGAEGPLLAAPGGDIRLALGGGFRWLALDVNVQQTPPGAPTRTTTDYTQEREVAFAYGELSVPLVGPDNAMPFAHRLSVNAAARYERYGGIDEVVTPKLGLSWQPVPDVTFNAAWGRAFKVPTLFQVNQIRTGALFLGTRFNPQPVPPLAAGDTVLVLSGGNPDLESERATTWTATLLFEPRFAPGLRLQASYFDVDYKGRVATPFSSATSALGNPVYRELVLFDPSPQQVLDLIATLPQGLDNQTGRSLDPAGVAAILDGSLRNAAAEHARGVDLVADYRLEAGPRDAVRFGAAASYLKSDRQLSVGQPVIERAGVIFNPPHWRARLSAAWERDQSSLSAFLNYVGPTLDNRFAPFDRVDDFLTFDLVARWVSGATAGALQGLEARLAVTNLFNAEPDVIRNSDPAAPPFDSTNQSAVGRFVGVTLAKQW